MVDLLRVETNERIDLEDFSHLINNGVDATQELAGNVLTSAARQRAWILWGFGMSNPSAKQLQVALGAALLSYRDQGVVKYAAVAATGDATKIVDLSTYPSATYNIYVRFEWVDDETKSRIFWDPSGDGSEFAQTIATRKTSNWSVRVETTSPGSEWLQIGTVVQSTMAITDQRPLYFEGLVSGSYASGWSTDGGGVANDRSATRGTYGVRDFQMFTAAMRQCLEDIKGRGLRRWWERSIGGMNIGFDANPTEDALFVKDNGFGLDYSGSDPTLSFQSSDALIGLLGTNRIGVKISGTTRGHFQLTGFHPATDEGWDLGTASLYWGEAYITNLFIKSGAAEGVSSDLLPSADSTYDLGSNTVRWAFLYADDVHTVDLAVSGTGSGSGVDSNLIPAVDGAYFLGSTVSGWNAVFVSAGGSDAALRVTPEGTNDVFSRYKSGTGGTDEKWWEFRFGSSGFVLNGLNDSEGGAVPVMEISRDGVSTYGGLLEMKGMVHARKDSGLTTSWDAALLAEGIDPVIWMRQLDTGVDANCRNWGLFLNYPGSGNTDRLRWACFDATYANRWDWLIVQTAGGASSEYDIATIDLSSTDDITLTTAEVIVAGALAVGGDAVPTTPSHLGLTSAYTLGNSGDSFTINGVSGTGSGTVSQGFIKVYVNGVARYIPFFNTMVG